MVSTTILEWGEASRIPSRISWALLICMSSSVMTRSGLVLPTWEEASLPVEDLPTTSTPSREEDGLQALPKDGVVVCQVYTHRVYGWWLLHLKRVSLRPDRGPQARARSLR